MCLATGLTGLPLTLKPYLPLDLPMFSIPQLALLQNKYR